MDNLIRSLSGDIITRLSYPVKLEDYNNLLSRCPNIYNTCIRISDDINNPIVPSYSNRELLNKYLNQLNIDHAVMHVVGFYTNRDSYDVLGDKLRFIISITEFEYPWLNGYNERINSNYKPRW